MRISDSMRLDAMVRNNGSLQEQYADASRIASTGVRIGSPSDDPTGAGQVVRIQGALDRTSAFRSAIGSAQGDLTSSESALASAGDVFARAGEIALQGANGSLNASDRAALADEVGQLQGQLVSIANTKGASGYLFGGTKTDTPPMDTSGAFLGNGFDRTAEVSPGLSMVTSASGALAFTAAGGRDVYADLSALKTALLANDPTAVAATVSNLDASRRQIAAVRGDAGIKANRLDMADAAHQAAEASLTTQKHAVADADPAAAYSHLMALQSAIEQAIAVTRNTLSTMSSVNRFG